MTNSETSWNFYTSNEEAWSAMLIACEDAKETIDLEQFIFASDEVGKRFIDVCERKAKAGIRVRFLWDAAGSWSFFSSSVVEDLKRKGIELVFFKTLLPSIFEIHNYRAWYFRDHRRSLIIDGKVGFTGSVCISKRMEDWRDTHVRIEGPVVEQMMQSFERMFDRARDKKIRRYPREKINAEFEYVTNTPLPRNRELYKRIVAAIRNAEKYIHISTPYFVPPRRIARVLRLATLRGVEVKIIMPRSSDFRSVDWAARTFFHGFLKSGIKIYLYEDRMIHSKTMIVDGNWSTIGTMNMDNISLLYNYEANIVSTNPAFAGELESHFINDASSTSEITYEIWQTRSFFKKIVTFFIKFIRELL